MVFPSSTLPGEIPQMWGNNRKDVPVVRGSRRRISWCILKGNRVVQSESSERNNTRTGTEYYQNTDIEPNRRHKCMKITKREETKRKINIDTMGVISGLHEEMKRTNEMRNRIHEEQIKLSSTEQMSMALQDTRRDKEQYDAIVQREYRLSQIEMIGTQIQSRDDPSGNESNDPNDGGNLNRRKSEEIGELSKHHFTIRRWRRQNGRRVETICTEGRNGRINWLKRRKPWNGGQGKKCSTGRKVV